MWEGGRLERESDDRLARGTYRQRGKELGHELKKTSSKGNVIIIFGKQMGC